MDGFWIDAGPVTNRELGRFARKTGYVTVAERARSIDRHDPARIPRKVLAARRLRAIISPAMHGARRPVKRDRGVLSAVIPTC